MVEVVSSSSSRPPLGGLVTLVVAAAGLKLGAPVLVPIAFALFLAVLVEPLFGALQARGVATGVAVLSTLLLLAGVFGAFLVLLLGSVGELREAAPLYLATLQERAAYTVQWWQAKGIAIEEWLPTNWREPKTIGLVVGGALRGTLALISEATIVMLVLVFMLFEAAALPSKLERLPLPVRQSLERFANVSKELQRYLLIKTLMSLTVGLATGLWVSALGLDLAVLCALAAFACHFIPNIGAILAAAPAMVIAFVQFDLMKAGVVGVGYLAIGLVLGSLVEPALLGRRLGLSPLVVFLSLIVWGWLWGPIGMFLSVPLTMACKIVLSGVTEWRWLAILLDAAPPRRVAPPEGA